MDLSEVEKAVENYREKERELIRRMSDLVEAAKDIHEVGRLVPAISNPMDGWIICS